LGRGALDDPGAVHDRLPASHAQRAAQIMRDAGVDVTVDMVAGEDHFLLFSRPDDVLADVAAFVRP
jgi:hypothetical protein